MLDFAKTVLTKLTEGRVEFVVVGGLCASARGKELITDRGT